MKELSYILFFSLFFIGCSFKTVDNKYEYKTTNAFSSYTHNFLSSNDLLASNDIKMAIKYSKQSANLKSLSKIYLGECALNISVGKIDSCKKYINIKDLVDNRDKLDAYYSLVTLSLEKNQIKNLPKIYQKFAVYKMNNQYKKAYKEIIQMNNITSQLISASLIKDNLNKIEINNIINLSSFFGYKKSNIFWLSKLKQLTTNKKEKLNISKKLLILKSR